MSRDQRLFLHDIVERCDRIADYTRDMEYASFVSDSKTFDAVARNLEIIGEAVKQLSPQTRASHSGVDWRKIAGLRDIVIHQYFGIDDEIIWA